VIRITLDAMGGDNAPRVEVEGAVLALHDLPPDFRIQLVGRTADIEAALKATPQSIAAGSRSSRHRKSWAWARNPWLP